MKGNKKGFTLIEMLIVIAIIAILASVFLVGLRGFRGGAYDSRRISDLQKVQSYLELYYAKNRAYPAGTFSDMATALTGANLGVSKIPNDPISGQTYEYAPCNGNQGYALKATLSTAGHSALREDDDGTVCGLACGANDNNETEYCVQF